MANQTSKQIKLRIRDELADVFKDVAGADLGHGVTTKEGRELARKKAAELVNRSGNAKPDSIPVVVKRDAYGLPEYVAGDEETTKKINAAIGGVNHAPAFDYYDKKLIQNKDAPFVEMLDMSGHGLRTSGILESDIPLLTNEFEHATKTNSIGQYSNAQLENLNLEHNGLFSKTGGKKLLASTLGHGYAGASQDWLREAALKNESGKGLLDKGTAMGQKTLANAIGLVANPATIGSTAAGGGIFLALRARDKSAAEDAKENKKGVELNLKSKALIQKYGVDTDWTSKDSYDNHRTNSDSYDPYTMNRAWQKVTEAADKNGRFSRVLEQSPELVFSSLMKAYQSEIDDNKGVIWKRDAKFNPLQKNGEYIPDTSALNAKQIEKLARQNGLTIAGFYQQSNKDDPSKPHIGFKTKDGRRINALLTVKSEKEMKEEEAASKATSEASTNEPSKPSPKTLGESLAQTAKEAKARNPFGWTYIDPTKKGYKALLDKDPDTDPSADLIKPPTFE